MLTNQASVSVGNKALGVRWSVAMGIAAAICSFLMSAGSAHALITGTYVDAEALYGLDNTTPNDSSTFFQPGYNNTVSGFSDGLWDDRSAAAPSGSPGSFGLNSSGVLSATQNIIEAGPSFNETVPTIKTSVTGLANAKYDVYVLYWSLSSGSDWGVRANLIPDDGFIEYDRAGTGGAIAGTSTSIVNGVGANTILYEAKIGSAFGTSFDVYIQNATGLGSGSRTEYDGVAYVDVGPAPEPASLSLLGVGGLLLIRRRR